MTCGKHDSFVPVCIMSVDASLTKILAKDRRLYICDVFSHWLRLCSDNDPGITAWSHKCHNVSNHQPICWMAFVQADNKGNIKAPHKMALCKGNTLVTGGFPSHSTSMSWGHHERPFYKYTISHKISTRFCFDYIILRVMHTPGNWNVIWSYYRETLFRILAFVRRTH